MRNRMTFLFLLALAVMMTTSAQAEDHRHHHGLRLPHISIVSNPHGSYGRGSEVGALLNDNMNMMDDMVGDLTSRICERHRGSGDSVERSTCYGVYTDAYGRYAGRNPYAANGGYGYRPYSRGVSPLSLEFGYGRSDYNPAKCVGKMFKEAEKYHQMVTAEQAMAMCTGRPIPEGPREWVEPQAPAQPPAPAAPTVVQSPAIRVNNCTGAHLFINGQGVESRAGINVWGDEIKVTGASCRVDPNPRKVSDTEYNLVCASK